MVFYSFVNNNELNCSQEMEMEDKWTQTAMTKHLISLGIAVTCIVRTEQRRCVHTRTTTLFILALKMIFGVVQLTFMVKHFLNLFLTKTWHLNRAVETFYTQARRDLHSCLPLRVHGSQSGSRGSCVDYQMTRTAHSSLLIFKW